MFCYWGFASKLKNYFFLEKIIRLDRIAEHEKEILFDLATRVSKKLTPVIKHRNIYIIIIIWSFTLPGKMIKQNKKTCQNISINYLQCFDFSEKGLALIQLMNWQ